MDRESKSGQKTFINELIIIIAIVIAGLALQIALGPFDYSIISFPVNVIVLAIMLLLLLVKPSGAVGRFGSAKVSVSLLAIITLMCLYMGIVANNGVKTSWPFVLTYLLILVNIILVIGKRIRQFKWKDYGFYLNHIGLFIFLFSAGLGSADMQRYFMRVYEGKVEWRGENSKTGELTELPVAISLEDFSMDVYPPKITIIDKRSGETFPAGKPSLMESFEGSSGNIGEWGVKVDSIKERPRVAPAAYIIAKNKNNGGTLAGWISCGNYFQPFKTLDISDIYCFAMTLPEPKRFCSDVEVFTKDGFKTSGKIEVNNPLSVGSWKIYQYSYDTNMGKDSEYSVFELIRDPWLIPVYIGIFMVMAGAVTLFWKGGRK
jgi:hypothetical protein